MCPEKRSPPFQLRNYPLYRPPGEFPSVFDVVLFFVLFFFVFFENPTFFFFFFETFLVAQTTTIVSCDVPIRTYFMIFCDTRARMYGGRTSSKIYNLNQIFNYVLHAYTSCYFRVTFSYQKLLCVRANTA